VREAAPAAVLAPATPNGRDLAAALVGLLDLPAFGPVRAVRVEGVPDISVEEALWTCADILESA